MIVAGLLLFTLSAVVGLAYLLRWLQRGESSFVLTLGHGLAAGAGLILVVVPWFGGAFAGPAGSLARFAVVVLLAAGTAGLAVVGLRLRRGTVPVVGAVAHGLAGVAGLLLLLLWRLTA